MDRNKKQAFFDMVEKHNQLIQELCDLDRDMRNELKTEFTLYETAKIIDEMRQFNNDSYVPYSNWFWEYQRIILEDERKEEYRSRHYARSTKACKVDMWYGNGTGEVDKIDVTFNDLDGEYRGNCYIKGKCVGDYVAKDTQAIEKQFPQIQFDWDCEWEPMDICLTESMKNMVK